MTYKTFRIILGGAAALIVIAGGLAANRAMKHPETTNSAPLRNPPGELVTPTIASGAAVPVANVPVATVPAVAVPTIAPDVTAASVLSSGHQSLRSFDSQIVALSKEVGGAEKQKDALHSGPRVDVFRDNGHTTPNRVKIDLNRDGKWDEKWDFSGTEVKRHVSPLDDEKYTAEYRLVGSEWVKK